MPIVEDGKPAPSWADRMEQDEASKISPDNLPAPTSTMDGDLRKVVEYHVNAEGKVVKTIKVYRIEKKSVPKAVALRKKWKKFGNAASDGDGPNTAQTMVADEVYLQLTTNKESLDQQSQDDDALKKLASAGKGMVQCRLCKGDHWTTHCPYKETLETGPTSEGTTAATQPTEPQVTEPKAPTKYIPPAKRYGSDAKREGESMTMRTRDDTATVRVTNLSEDATEQDLRELFGHFGPIQRIYLARDRTSQRSKGFAFVNYYDRHNAEKAIKALDGFGYHYLILKVEWAKPQEDK